MNYLSLCIPGSKMGAKLSKQGSYSLEKRKKTRKKKEEQLEEERGSSIISLPQAVVYEDLTFEIKNAIQEEIKDPDQKPLSIRNDDGYTSPDDEGIYEKLEENLSNVSHSKQGEEEKARRKWKDSKEDWKIFHNFQEEINRRTSDETFTFSTIDSLTDVSHLESHTRRASHLKDEANRRVSKGTFTIESCDEESSHGDEPSAASHPKKNKSGAGFTDILAGDFWVGSKSEEKMLKAVEEPKHGKRSKTVSANSNLESLGDESEDEEQDLFYDAEDAIDVSKTDDFIAKRKADCLTITDEHETEAVIIKEKYLRNEEVPKSNSDGYDSGSGTASSSDGTIISKPQNNNDFCIIDLNDIKINETKQKEAIEDEIETVSDEENVIVSHCRRVPEFKETFMRRISSGSDESVESDEECLKFPDKEEPNYAAILGRLEVEIDRRSSSENQNKSCIDSNSFSIEEMECQIEVDDKQEMSSSIEIEKSPVDVIKCSLQHLDEIPKSLNNNSIENLKEVSKYSDEKQKAKLSFTDKCDSPQEMSKDATTFMHPCESKETQFMEKLIDENSTFSNEKQKSKNEDPFRHPSQCKEKIPKFAYEKQKLIEKISFGDSCKSKEDLLDHPIEELENLEQLFYKKRNSEQFSSGEYCESTEKLKVEFFEKSTEEITFGHSYKSQENPIEELESLEQLLYQKRNSEKIPSGESCEFKENLNVEFFEKSAEEISFGHSCKYKENLLDHPIEAFKNLEQLSDHNLEKLPSGESCESKENLKVEFFEKSAEEISFGHSCKYKENLLDHPIQELENLEQLLYQKRNSEKIPSGESCEFKENLNVELFEISAEEISFGHSCKYKENLLDHPIEAFKNLEQLSDQKQNLEKFPSGESCESQENLTMTPPCPKLLIFDTDAVELEELANVNITKGISHSHGEEENSAKHKPCDLFLSPETIRKSGEIATNFLNLSPSLNSPEEIAQDQMRLWEEEQRNVGISEIIDVLSDISKEIDEVKVQIANLRGERTQMYPTLIKIMRDVNNISNNNFNEVVINLKNKALNEVHMCLKQLQSQQAN